MWSGKESTRITHPQTPQQPHELTLVFMSRLLSVAETGVRDCRAGEDTELRPSALTKSKSLSSAVRKKFSWPWKRIMKNVLYTNQGDGEKKDGKTLHGSGRWTVYMCFNWMLNTTYKILFFFSQLLLKVWQNYLIFEKHCNFIYHH